MQKAKDKQISDLIFYEAKRQRETLTMIPSENYTSQAVRDAVGSVLMHKYAEGYPGKRYYQGNSVIDEVENLCRNRALKIFNLNANIWGVNVQPHSGCEANLAVYNAILEPQDTIMAMYLPDGGHLSHGWHTPDKKLTFVSKIFNVQFYHVNPKTRVFDYDEIAKIAEKTKPKLLISGGTAYPREIDYEKMAGIAHSVGAYYLSDIAHEAGLVAGGASKSPFPFADFVTMTTHKTLRGPRGAMIFAKSEFMDRINSSIIPGLQGGPHIHSIAGIAVALNEASKPEFKKYARQVVKNAQVLASEFAKAGIDVVSGGTDKHLVLLDLRSIGVSAWVAAWALEYAGIIVNRNTVPNDTGSSYYPSGIRLGTPAVTTRGMKETEMKQIAGWIIEILKMLKPYQIPEDKIERQNFLKNIYVILPRQIFIQKVHNAVLSLNKVFPI